MTEYNAIIFKSGDQWRLIPAEVVKEVYTAKTNSDVYVGVQEAKDKSLPIVNKDEIWTVIKRPGIESRFYEWPGTWEKVYGIDFGGNDFAFGTDAKLIAPQQNAAHGYTEGAEVPQQPQAESPDVRIMKIVAQFDYLVNRNEQLTIDELKNRAQFCPGIMDEPELQELVQIIKHSTISSVYKNSMGFWWNFKSKQP